MSCERDSPPSYQYFVENPGQINCWSFSHSFLCGIPISIFTKASEAKERQGS